MFQPPSPRTSGQRLHQLLVVVGFLALVALGPVVYLLAPPARTQASTPAPCSASVSQSAVTSAGEETRGSFGMRRMVPGCAARVGYGEPGGTLAPKASRRRAGSPNTSVWPVARRANAVSTTEKNRVTPAAQVPSAISCRTSSAWAFCSATDVPRAIRAASQTGRTASQRGDIGRAKESLEVLQQKLDDLEQEARDEIDEIKQSIRVDKMDLESLDIRPRKSDIEIRRLSLVWLPYRVDSSGIAEAAY